MSSARRARLTEMRIKAEGLLNESHVGKDIVDVLRGLLQGIAELEGKANRVDGLEADIRLLHARIEGLTSELKRKDDEKAAIKKSMLDALANELRNIASEATKITAGMPGDSQDPACLAAKNIILSLRNLIEKMAKG